MSRSLPQVEGYTFTACIGSGTFGEVYKGIRNRDGMEIAGKVIMESKLKTKKLRESLEKEASIQSEAKHPNIVSLLEVIKLPSETLLIMEYCDGGDLAEFLEKKKKLPEEVAKRFLLQLVAALDFMNDRRIIHRDIKPKNILLTRKDENATLKLADFGFARIIDHQGVADTQCGTPLYMAPEVSLGKKYGLKADLWSIGCIFYEMLVGSRPYEAATQVQLAEAIKNKPVTFPPGCVLSDSCKDLILKLLQKDQSLRISQVELFMHPFLDYETYSKSNPIMKEKEELLKSKIELEKMDDSPNSTKRILEELRKMITTYGDYEVLEKENTNDMPSNVEASGMEEEEGFVTVDKEQVRLNQIIEESSSRSLSRSTLKQAIEFTDQYFKNPLRDSQDIFIREVLERYTSPEHSDVSNIIFHTQRLVAIQKSADVLRNDGHEEDAFSLYVRCSRICKYITDLLSEVFEDHQRKLPKQLSGAPQYIHQKYEYCMEYAKKMRHKNYKEVIMQKKQAQLIVTRARELARDGGFEETTNIENSKAFYVNSILHFETVLTDFSNLLSGDDEHHVRHQITSIVDRLQAIQSKK